MWKVILIATCVLWGVNDAEYSFGDMENFKIDSQLADRIYDDMLSHSGLRLAFHAMKISPFHREIMMNYFDYQKSIYDMELAASDDTETYDELTADTSDLDNEIPNSDDLFNQQQEAPIDNAKWEKDYNVGDNKDTLYDPSFSGDSVCEDLTSDFIDPESSAMCDICEFSGCDSSGAFEGSSFTSCGSNSDINCKQNGHRGAKTTEEP